VQTFGEKGPVGLRGPEECTGEVHTPFSGAEACRNAPGSATGGFSAGTNVALVGVPAALPGRGTRSLAGKLGSRGRHGFGGRPGSTEAGALFGRGRLGHQGG